MIIILAVALSGCGNKDGLILAGGKPVNEWVRTLSDLDPKLRKKAAEKLGNAGSNDPSVITALCGALQDRNATVRCEAILALAKTGSAAKQAVEPLKALGQQDRDPRVRSYAVKALKNLQE